VTVILEHDIGFDLLRACRTILQPGSRRTSNDEAATSAVRVITPFNLPEPG